MTSEEKKEILLSKINFGSGVIKENGLKADGFRVEYKGGLYLEFWWWEGRRYCNCYLKKEDTTIIPHSSVALDERFFQWVRHCVAEIESGKYRNKKSRKEMIQKEIERRGLTSCMNNTKWQEFKEAMEQEMPFPPPYIYKTLFEKDEGEYFGFSEDVPYVGDYDDESFADYDYKIIEWVKVRPRYCEYHGGRLAGKSILHDAEQEFVEILKKYSIPYEVERGTYIIYGYRQ